jgi:tRNA(adenine34) deaminase
MKQALREAESALAKDEIPIGAVVVLKDQIIARAHNLTESLNDVTAHAEMQAITSAADYLGGKYLDECTMYVTLEPCVMCSGALAWAQLGSLVYGARDLRKRKEEIDRAKLYHPKTKIEGGLMEEECGEILKSFFEKKRE